MRIRIATGTASGFVTVAMFAAVAAMAAAIFAASGWSFAYWIDACFGKDLPLFVDAIGAFLPWNFLAAFACLVAKYLGVATPFFHV